MRTNRLLLLLLPLTFVLGIAPAVYAVAYPNVEDDPDRAWDVAIPGNSYSSANAYVADGCAVRVIDVDDPAVTDESGGLRILDVSAPSAPREVGYHDTPEGAGEGAATGDWIHVVGQRDGLFVLRHAGTQVGGTITTDTTWTVTDSPYVVASDVEIQDGATLTIEPGVTVRFDGGKKMQVNGGLVARGTMSRPITFTSNQPIPEPGDWGDIEFTETAITTIYHDEAYAGGSVLQYCVVEYGGYNHESGSPNGTVETTQVLIDHCTIRNNAATGIYARGTVDTPAMITYNTIYENSGNRGGGIYALHSTLTGNQVSKNSASDECTSYGGGIYASYVTLISNTVDHNTVTSSFCDGIGGGIYATDSLVTDNIITENTASPSYQGYGNGGGICAEDSTVANNTISRNVSNFGGGVYAESSTVLNNVVNYNAASLSALNNDPSYGGGIYATSGSTISGNVIRGNWASGGTFDYRGFGGGIHTRNSTVLDNIIIGNTACWGGDGGGIYASRSAMTNNSVIRNTAGRGSGIYATSGSSVLTNTITANTISTDLISGQGSGVYLVDSDALVNTMRGNVVIANTGPSGSTIGDVNGGVAITGTPQVHDNDFYDNDPYDVVVLSSDDVSGTHNYWGTVESAEIQAHIFDCEEDGNLGCFLYDPFRSESSPGAPLPPPTDLTGAFEPGQVALSWKSLPGFRNGLSYTVYYDTDSSIPPYDGVGLDQGNSPIAIGDRTGYTLTGLASDASYYFAVTAHDDAGRESWYSNVAQGEADGYTAFISPSGGRLAAVANDITVTFPADVVTSTVVITLSPRLSQPTGDLVGVHRFYDLAAVYSDTRQPAQLVPHASYTTTVGYADRVPAREATLGLYWWDDAQWSQEGITSTVDVNANLVVAQVDHLSRFAVLGEAWKRYLPLVMKDCGGH